MMKKITYLLPAILMALTLSSCKEKETELTPTQIGRALWGYAASNNSYVMEHPEDAFKLNILLTQAAAQEVSLTNAEALMAMKIGSSDIVLFPKLFPNATLAVSGNNYDIKYKRPINATISRPTGTVSIVTGGKLLQELGETGMWTISLYKNDETPFIYEGNSTGYYFYTAILKGEYTITAGTLPKSWDITVSNFSAVSRNYEDFKTKWTGDFTAVMKEGGFTYTEMRSAEFEFYGSGNGTTLSTADLVYTVEKTSPLVYKADCYGGGLPQSGTELVKFAEDEEVDPSKFPARNVNVEWNKGTADCTYVMTVNYNGYTEDVRWGN